MSIINKIRNKIIDYRVTKYIKKMYGKYMIIKRRCKL